MISIAQNQRSLNITKTQKIRILLKKIVMKNSLMIYLNKRLLGQDTVRKKSLEEGPVITISREVGCNGLKLAVLLAERLNLHKLSAEWRVLSKEVFQESARELNMDPERIRKTFKHADKYTFDEILRAFNDKSYKSDRKISKTVADVIHSFAIDGFCIIVGRASHIIAKDIKNSLHIRLVAPLEYRINSIMNTKRLNRKEAIIFIHKIEIERDAFRNSICKDKNFVELFDLSINRDKFVDEEIVDIIEYAVNKKKILQDYKSAMEFF